MLNRNQAKTYNYGTNQSRKIQYNKIQLEPNLNPNNNVLKKNITPTITINNRNMQNNNINQQRNQNLMHMNNYNNNINMNNNNDELSKAILIIRRECKKKDDRIRDLEKRVLELTKKLNILLKNNKNSIDFNLDEENNIQEYRPFTGSPTDKLKNEFFDGGMINKNIRGYSMGYTGTNIKNNIRNNNYMQSNSQNKINYNSDTEKVVNKKLPGYDNLSHSNDHSLLTYNGGAYQNSSTKTEVKNYLKEVKKKIEPRKFKEFIRNIKLLTAKNNSTLNKDIIVESVRILFGEEHKDLFIKFESIIGFKK